MLQEKGENNFVWLQTTNSLGQHPCLKGEAEGHFKLGGDFLVDLRTFGISTLMDLIAKKLPKYTC